MWYNHIAGCDAQPRRGMSRVKRSREEPTNTVSAPGKLMVMGEYAVLQGATALVMAVDRRLVVRFTADSDQGIDRSPHDPDRSAESSTISPEIALALSLGDMHAEPQKWTTELDSRALHDLQGRKLGLGSSSAKAVASAAFVRQTTVAEQVFALALKAHRAVSPQGSGADVAASTYGGLIAFSAHEGDTLPTVEQVTLPSALRWRAYFSGRSASTAELIAHVSSYSKRDRHGHAHLMRAVQNASATFLQACFSSDAGGCLEAVREHHEVMVALSTGAKTAIVDEPLKAFTAALPASAAVKPSGAGGGDVSLVFHGDACDEERLDAIAEEYGFTYIDTQIDPEGPRFE